ncbi:MAG: gliding motility-associated C-terminal domain-containing protein [Crocinitomicaceae bacterium]|nr:gliding motility-associated C-terminal domain-containing protein [Crocinitomicaceae bacterium]
MKTNWLNRNLLVIALLAGGAIQGFSQTTVSFPFTGAPTSWTVPNCVTSITITVAGAQGGNALDGASYTGSAGTPVLGGEGAVVTATIPVTPGDVIDINVGGQGTIGGPGYNGGGTGNFSTDGNLVNGSAGGGGSTNVNLNGSPIIIAAGGGGAGGGSYSFGAETNIGGDGGCATGQAPSPGSPWIGTGGGGGTQFAPGAGGAPWAGVPTGGFAGVGGTGGQGGIWQTAPGGGGGGGYFGGGGGGNDGCCTGANGGAGGGGGSSLVPGGAGCTQGANTGNGYVTITYTGGGSTASLSPAAICEGSTTTLSLVGSVSPFNWESSSDGGVTWTTMPGATTTPYVTGALSQDMCYRAFEPGGGCSGTSYSNVICVTVNPMPTPNAGLDDTICFPTGYVLQGTSAGGTTAWTQYTGAGATAFAPSAAVLNATATPTAAGAYQYILSESDPSGICPAGKDTVAIFFADENHTTSFTDPTCNGYADGSITITSTGNIGAINYSYDGGASYVASNTSGLTMPAGTYTVISEDYFGCSHQSVVTLTDPPLVIVSVSNDTTVCENGTATVSASATGGTTYSYHWSMTADLGAVQTVSPTVAENITVFAENEVGCVSAPLDIDITLHAPITATITVNDSICPGYDSQHTVVPAGGYMGYNYAWTANGSAIMAVNPVLDINPTSNTNYCVTVTDACESTPRVVCTATIMREVPNPIFTSDTTQGCSPTIIEFQDLTTLMAPAYVDSVTWIIEGIMYHDLVPFSHTFVNVGSYDIWFEVYTNYGCHNSITVDDYITVHPNPEAMFYANPNPTTIFNTEVDFNNLSTPGANTYYWSFTGGNPTSSMDESPTVVYPEGIANEYPVQLIVVNEFNCPDTVVGIVDVQSDILIFAPNAFTPDGDEFNETWRIYIDGIDIYDFHLTVFNRWGEIVWESYNPEGQWDGTYGSTKAKTGTYVWVIEAKDKFSDKKVEWRGHVTVLK